jgi:dolichol-phosphate mannosyltransferase
VDLTSEPSRLRTLVLTPTYQEAENIGEFLHRVRAAVPDADILVVDDNSPDGTADIAERVATELGQIEVLRRPEKRGLGEAYRAGLALGLQRNYGQFVQLDADLSHDPAAIPALLQALNSGAVLAIGSRYVPGGTIPDWPWLRRALSRYGNRYAGLLLGFKVLDATSGFRAYRAEALKSINYESTRALGYGFLIETTYRVSRQNGTIAEVPITFTDRVRGHSKVSVGIFAEELLLVTAWGLRDRILRHGRGRHRV